MIFHPMEVSALNQFEKIIRLFEQKPTLSERISRDGLLSFDLIISLLEDIENDTLDEEIDLKELNEFLIYLTRLGFCGDAEEEFLLENDIEDLLEEDRYFFTFDSSYEVVLCGGIKKAWKNTRKYVKKHKKEFLIGTGIVVGAVVLGIGVAAAIGAAGAAASDSSSKKGDKNDESNSAKAGILPDPSPIFSPMQQSSLTKEIIQEHVTSFKETIREEIHLEPSENWDDPSFLEKARDIGSYLAHQALDGASEIVSFVPQLFDEVKEAGSRFISGNENLTDSKSQHVENLEKAIARGHQIIDDAFSTDQAKSFSREAQQTGWENEFDVGILPPPGVFGATLVQESQLLEAGQAIDRAGFTRAGRALMKHGYREDIVFPKPIGNPAKINAHGQKILEEIITDKKAISYPNRFGGQDVFTPSGKGARFDEKGNLMGFLQPRRPR